MPFAITLMFDPATKAAIAALWRALASAGIDDDRARLGYPAHVTLAIYPDATPLDPLCAAVDRMADRWCALPMDLTGFGVFPGSDAVVWVAPLVTAALRSYQAALIAALADVPPHPHYTPDHWVPHVTMTRPIPNPEAALSVLRPLWRPMAGRLERLELLRFRPVRVVRSHGLAVAERPVDLLAENPAADDEISGTEGY